MPTYEEIQRLVLEVENLNKLKDLNQTLEAEQKLMNGLVESFKQGSVGQAQYTQRMALHGEKVLELNKDIKELEKASKGALSAMGTMQLGYALQDFFAAQGNPAQKFNAIANNLQMFAASMGVGGGWFIAITAAIAGIQALANNWDTLEAYLKGLPDPKELKAKAEAAKRKAEEYKRLLEQPTQEEKRQQGQGVSALDSYDQGRLAAGLKAALVAQGGAVGGTDKQYNEFIGRNAHRMPVEQLVDAWMQENERIKGGQYDAEVQRIMQGARGSGPESQGLRKRIVDLAQGNEGAFPPGFLTWARESLLGQRPPRPGGELVGPPIDAFLLQGELEGKRALETQQRREAEAAQRTAVQRREALSRETPAERRRRMNAAAPSEWASPIGQATQTAGDVGLELAQLRTEAALNQADAAADQALGMMGPALQRQLQIEARIQAIVRKLSGVDAGAGATGLYSYLPTGTW